MTKREIFEVVANVFEGIDNENRDEVIAQMRKEIAALDAKAVRAREKAAEKRAEGDALRDSIQCVLGKEPKTINEILEDLGDENLTPAKVTARLTQLVKAEVVAKSQVKVDGRKLTAYSICL